MNGGSELWAITLLLKATSLWTVELTPLIKMQAAIGVLAQWNWDQCECEAQTDYLKHHPKEAMGERENNIFGFCRLAIFGVCPSLFCSPSFVIRRTTECEWWELSSLLTWQTEEREKQKNPRRQSAAEIGRDKSPNLPCKCHFCLEFRIQIA